MIKKLISIIVICITMSICTSCWDYEDINDKSIVMYTGLDKIGDKLMLTSEVVQRTVVAAEGRENKQLLNISPVIGRNLDEIRRELDKETALPLFVGSVRAIVFGESYARDGIEPFIQYIDKTYDYRKTSNMVVLKQPTVELYKVNPDKRRSNAFIIEEIISYLEENGETTYTKFRDIIPISKVKGTGIILPYMRIDENNFIRYEGLAVLKNYKMADMIPMRETEGITNLIGEKPRLIEILPSYSDIDNLLSFQTKRDKKTIKTEYKDEKVIINIDVNMSAELRLVYRAEDVDEKDIKVYEKKLSDKIKKDIEKVILLSQKEFKADIFEFYKYFRAENPKIYNEIDWAEKYPEAKINVNVKTIIRNLRLHDFNLDKER